MAQKMDDEAIQHCMRVLDEIGDAVEKVGMVLQRADLKDTPGIPSGVITFPDSRSETWAIACSMLMTPVMGIPTVFVQLFMLLTMPQPEKRYLLEMFIEGCDKKFMLADLGIFDDSLGMQYILALSPDTAISAEHFQSTLGTFVCQARAINQVAVGLCNGTLTMEQALDFNAFE